MGEVVGAGLIAHVPTIVLPEKIRRELNNGEDTTLVSGLQQLRTEVFDVLDYDTVVVLDSHWATTVEFVVTVLAALRAGLVVALLPQLWRQAELTIALNRVGVHVWETIATPTSVGALQDNIEQRFDVRPEQCRKDLESLLSDLSQFTLISVQHAPAS